MVLFPLFSLSIVDFSRYFSLIQVRWGFWRARH
jgi:hypothetical protein